ncbi:MAG: hypothetical protein M3525_09990 [Acidobacteriota bacterium]|nr:hypothetical protein [Acidobacteriota bacterium]
MGILDKIFGSNEPQTAQRQDNNQSQTGQTGDEQAIARYRYMLQTAPPETIEQAHAEAFTKLTPEQRQMILQQLNQVAPENERGAVTADDPQSLARAATRAEVRQPGTMERTFGGMGGGMGFGGMMATSFLGSIAGVVVGSAIAQSFFGDSGFGGAGESDGQNAADTNQDVGETGDDATAADLGGGDLDGGFGDFGGDF